MALAAESSLPSERKIISVGDLTRLVKKTIEDTIRYVWVAGEISNLKGASSGHLYFTLKDAESQIPCAMWRSFAGRLRFQPEDGMQVIAFGRVEVYLPHGKYQLIVEDMEPRGVGALQLKFEQLKEKLAKEGLFDIERKRPLPFLPRKIALVTSPMGAAVQDMVRTIRTRCPAVHLLIYPVKVQGPGAAEEIAAAIGHLNLAVPDLDVMIVGRGGGSIEDLWSFNEEVVARAIFASRVPVVSAVGHETDTTISDFVADVRALTPTDGAVKAVPKLDELMEGLEDLGTKLKRALRTRAELARSILDGLAGGRELGRVEELPQQMTQRLDEMDERLRVGLSQAAQIPRQRIESMANLIRSHALRTAETATARLRQAAASLEALSPVKVLARGYSITRLAATQEILTEARQARPGDRILTILRSGTLTSRVEPPEPTSLNA